ncbi:hypothetical protein FRC11_005924 [Ceratobasidium sp. 423]|nr:hypothetical protein FRC11_005924 [Ceratobasidium sp. 423]
MAFIALEFSTCLPIYLLNCSPTPKKYALLFQKPSLGSPLTSLRMLAKFQNTALLGEAGFISSAYIEHTETYTRYHDRYYTNLADYSKELSENLTKCMEERPQVTPPLSKTFALTGTKHATGAAVEVNLIHAMETILRQIKDVAKTPKTVVLMSRKKSRVDEISDQAFAADVTDLEGLVELAKSALGEKRIASKNSLTEPGLDRFIWRRYGVEFTMEDIRGLHERPDDERQKELWKNGVAERCQVASHLCQELKDEVRNYLSENPQSLLHVDLPNEIPTMDSQLLG